MPTTFGTATRLCVGRLALPAASMASSVKSRVSLGSNGPIVRLDALPRMSSDFTPSTSSMYACGAPPCGLLHRSTSFPPTILPLKRRGAFGGLRSRTKDCPTVVAQ